MKSIKNFLEEPNRAALVLQGLLLWATLFCLKAEKFAGWQAQFDTEGLWRLSLGPDTL